MSSISVSRLDGVNSSTAVKSPVHAVATTNIVLSGLQTVGGVTLDGNLLYRVLLTGQTNPVENGIYDASTGSWTRSDDFDDSRDVVTGTIVVAPVSSPVYYYRVTSVNPIVPGSSTITFSTQTGLDTLVADLANGVANLVGSTAIKYKQTPAELAASVTPVNLYIPDHVTIGGMFLLQRYGQNGTASPDTTALTSALAVANGTGIIIIPANYAGSNPSSLSAGITIEDRRPAGAFPTSSALLGAGAWININGNPEGALAGFHCQTWRTTPSTTSSAILGTNKVTGDLTAAGGAHAGGTFEFDTVGTLTGISGNICQALTGQTAIRSLGQTLPLVVGIEGGGGIDRTTTTTNINTIVGVQGDGATNVSSAGATITNAYGGRFIQSTASGITNNNYAISSVGDQMFRVGDNIRVENGSSVATIAMTFTSNIRWDVPSTVDVVFGKGVGFFGVVPPSQRNGYGTPTNGARQSSFDATSISTANVAKALAALIVDLKAYGILGS